MIPPEHQQQVAVWRQKAADGTLTKEDCRDFVAVLRQGRFEAAKAATSTKRTKAKAAIPNAGDLLDELDELS